MREIREIKVQLLYYISSKFLLIFGRVIYSHLYGLLNQKDSIMAERRKFKKRFCKYCEQKVEFIDYKDLGGLKFSLSERFKIMPRRLTGNCKRHQELVTVAIKRARQTALIPYIVDRKNVVENPFENVR